jgi:ribosomal protein L40E
MLCAKCNHHNLPDALFCTKCGANVEIGCSSCGTAHPADANFCRKCGKALGATAPVSNSGATNTANTPRVEVTPERQTAEGLDGERKTVTALFADIKGSMDLIEDLDPEEARRLVDPALKLMMDAVHRYEGYVAQHHPRPPLMPASEKDQAQVMMWEELMDGVLGPQARMLIIGHFLRSSAPELRQGGQYFAQKYQHSQYAEEQAKLTVERILIILKHALDGHQYLVGDTFTRADLTTASMFLLVKSTS